MKPRISIITGSPATGKSAVAELTAGRSMMEKSLHMHTDDFYRYLKKGYIPPHLPASQKQNEVVISAVLASAKHFSSHGYDVIVDGIIGPWFITPWKSLASEGYEVNYFILRASKEETLKRALQRSKLTKEENIELNEAMRNQFDNLGQYEAYVIDTTCLSADKTADLVLDGMEKKKFLL